MESWRSPSHLRASGHPVPPQMKTSLQKALLAMIRNVDTQSDDILNLVYSRGTWVAQSVGRPTSAQALVSHSVSSSPTSGSVPTAQSLKPTWDSVSPPLCPSYAHALSLSVS